MSGGTRRFTLAVSHGPALTGVGLGVSAASQLAANLAILAASSASVFADVAVLTISVTFLAIGTRAGIDRMFVPEVQAALTLNGRAAADSVAASLFSAGILLAASVALLMILGPLALLLDPSLSNPLGTNERVLIAGWLACDSIRFITAEAHRQRGRFLRAAIASFGLRAPLFLTFVSAIIVAGVPLTRDVALGAGCAASALTLLLALPRMWRRYAWWRTNPFTALRLAAKSHALLVSSTLAASIVAGADVWLAGYFFPVDVTARYGFAVALVASIAMLPAAVAGGLAPRLARLLSEGNVSEAQQVSVRFVKVISAMAVAAYISLVALAERVSVAIGGETYRGVNELVVILGLGQLVGVAAGISGWNLIYARRYQATWLITALVAFTALIFEVSAGTYGNVYLLAGISACATAAIPITSNIVAVRTIGMRSDVLAHSGRAI